MYQGPMTRTVLVDSENNMDISFGPFDPGDEVDSVVLQIHSSGAAATSLTIAIERSPGSSRGKSFGGGNLVTAAPLLTIGPVGFDSLLLVPVNAVFLQRELLLMQLLDISGLHESVGMIGIIFRGPISSQAGKGGGGGGGGGGNGRS